MSARTMFTIGLLAASSVACVPVGTDGRSVSVDWDADRITLGNDVVLRASDIPSTIAVSADATFGVAGDITSAALSPDGEWIAFSTSGAAHDAGWLHDVGEATVRPVAFQYGGGVRVDGWTSDATVAFAVTTPEPAETTVVIDVRALPAYPRVAQDGAASSESSDPAGWETYRDEEIGVAVRHPPAMRIDGIQGGPSATAGVHMMLWGPTQTDGTELFDGIHVSIQRGAFSGSLRGFVEDRIEDLRAVGTITVPMAETTFRGEFPAYVFTASTLGTHRHIVADVGEGEYLHVTYSFPDPTGQRHAETALRIVDSIDVIAP